MQQIKSVALGEAGLASGSCTDTGDRCAPRKKYCKYAASSRRRDFGLYMKKSCLKTCGICGCEDKGSKCAARKTYCKYAASSRRRGFGLYTKQYCAKTCGVCDSPVFITTAVANAV